MVFSHITSLIIAIACIAWWQWMEMLEIFAHRRTVTVMHFTDQNWISKTVYCIRCVMVFKIGFTNWNAKSALLRASMVVTYYIKLFRTGSDRHNVILMSQLLLVAEATRDLNRISEIVDSYLWDSTSISSVQRSFGRILFYPFHTSDLPSPENIKGPLVFCFFHDV